MKKIRSLIGVLLVLVMLGSVGSPVIADKPRVVDQKQPIKTEFVNLKPAKLEVESLQCLERRSGQNNRLLRADRVILCQD